MSLGKGLSPGGWQGAPPLPCPGIRPPHSPLVPLAGGNPEPLQKPRQVRKATGRSARGLGRDTGVMGAAGQCPGCRTVCRLLGARVDHRWVERGARPKQEERAWESWSLGLVSSSGLSRPPRESGMREGPPSSVGQRDLRVRGEQGRNAGLERPGHNGKGSRLQRSGTEASVGWSSQGPRGRPAKPDPRPPTGSPADGALLCQPGAADAAAV